MNTYQGTKERTIQTVAKACLASCRKLTEQLQRTKQNILAELRGTFEAPEDLLRLAVNEAEALAWQTDFPHLVFADLATEKIQAVAAWHARQQLLARHQFISELAA
ncbi:MAG: hypothetical protein ABSE16_05280 [Verrucomicrobiota bacterium]|jgi:hypothetical protein